MTRDRYGKIVWVRVFIDRMRGRIAPLSPEAAGVYFRLFFAYLDRQGPLPDDDPFLASIAQISVGRWRTIRRELEGLCIFSVRDGFLYHDIADERIQEFTASSRRNRANVGKRYGQIARLEDAS